MLPEVLENGFIDDFMAGEFGGIYVKKRWHKDRYHATITVGICRKKTLNRSTHHFKFFNYVKIKWLKKRPKYDRKSFRWRKGKQSS